MKKGLFSLLFSTNETTFIPQKHALLDDRLNCVAQGVKINRVMLTDGDLDSLVPGNHFYASYSRGTADNGSTLTLRGFDINGNGIFEEDEVIEAQIIKSFGALRVSEQITHNRIKTFNYHVTASKFIRYQGHSEQHFEVPAKLLKTEPLQQFLTLALI